MHTRLVQTLSSFCSGTNKEGFAEVKEIRTACYEHAHVKHLGLTVSWREVFEDAHLYVKRYSISQFLVLGIPTNLNCRNLCSSQHKIFKKRFVFTFSLFLVRLAHWTMLYFYQFSSPQAILEKKWYLWTNNLYAVMVSSQGINAGLIQNIMLPHTGSFEADAFLVRRRLVETSENQWKHLLFGICWDSFRMRMFCFHLCCQSMEHHKGIGHLPSRKVVQTLIMSTSIWKISQEVSSVFKGLNHLADVWSFGLLGVKSYLLIVTFGLKRQSHPNLLNGFSMLICLLICASVYANPALDSYLLWFTVPS